MASILVEDLDPIVVPVADEQPASGVESDRVGCIELVRAGSSLSPGLEELAILGKFRNAIVTRSWSGVPFGDEDVAIGSDRHIGRLIEQAGLGAGDSGLAQRHQNLAIGAEFENLHAPAIPGLFVGHPEVALPIDRGTVREDKHALAPSLQQVARRVELENGRLSAAGAGVVVAAVDNVDAAVGRHFHGCDRGPWRVVGRMPPVAHGAIGVWQIVQRLDGGLGECPQSQDHGHRERES